MKTVTSPILIADYLLRDVLPYAWQNALEEPTSAGRMDWLCMEDTSDLFPELGSPQQMEGAERVRIFVSTHPPANPRQRCYYFRFDEYDRNLYWQPVLDAGSWTFQATHHRLNEWLRNCVEELETRQFYGWVEEVK